MLLTQPAVYTPGCIAGGAWLDVTQGSADAVLVPLLLQAAHESGSAADVAALTAAQQALADDRNVALEELNRVRHGLFWPFGTAGRAVCMHASGHAVALG